MLTTLLLTAALLSTQPGLYASRTACLDAHLARPALQSTADGSNKFSDEPFKNASQRARLMVDELVAKSYPELRTTRLEIRLFSSRSDYFKARFALPQFFFGRMRYLLFVNPRVFELDAPPEGVRAILAHELGHIVYYQQRNRLQLLGLTRLESKRFTAQFERWADLTAISHGFADGLKQYRRWLYEHVPASRLREKHRNYFSPEEIDAILSATRLDPELLKYWLAHVPLNLFEIQARR